MKRLTTTVCLAVLCGCASGPPPAADYSSLYDGEPQAVFGTELPTADAAEAIMRGDRASAQRQYDKALYFYIRSLSHDASSAPVFVRIGAIHERRGNRLLAVRAYNEALQRVPEHHAVRERLAVLLLKAGHTQKAQEAFAEVVTANAAGWRSHNGLGVIADLQGEHEKAVGHFNDALELRPDSPQILNNLGYSHYLSGDLKMARDAFVRALLVDEGHEQALRNLALVEVRVGNYDNALELLGRVSSPAQAHNDVGYLCMLEGRHADAERYLRKATELSASYYQLAHRNLARNGRALADARARNEALASADRAAPAMPDTRSEQPEPVALRSAADISLAASALPGALRPRPAVPPPGTEPTPAAVETNAAPAATAPEIATPSRAARAESSAVASDSGETAADRGPRPAAQQYQKRWVKASALNVRDAASSDAEKLDQLRRGHVVRVLRRDGEWAFIRYWEYVGGRTLTRSGWVYARFLTAESVRV